MNILCFDISSGGISGALFDSELRAVRYAEVQWDAATLSVPGVIAQFQTIINDLKPTTDDNIGAICLDTFLHNCVLLDAVDQPLTPVFTWLDHRGMDGVEFIRTRMGDDFHQRTGCRFHPMFPVFKLASMRLTGNSALTAVKRIVSIKCLLNHGLTNTWVEDLGIASSSGLFNVNDGSWDLEILGHLQLSTDCLPPVASRTAIVGTVTREAAARFGLPEGIRVVNGTGDGFAANIGSGCETADRIAVTLGTSGVVRQTLTRPVLASESGTFCYVADRNVYVLGCAGSNGGNVLDWGRSIFGASADPGAATDPPIFIPLLNGERSPEWDPNLTGSWYRLTSRHTAADLSRSILEGVVFNLAYFVEIIEATSGAGASAIVLSGNGFLNPLAAPILAAVIRVPVFMPEEPGLITLCGTAICARRALGLENPPLRSHQVLALNDPKILHRYAEYRRFRGTLGRA